MAPRAPEVAPRPRVGVWGRLVASLPLPVALVVLPWIEDPRVGRVLGREAAILVGAVLVGALPFFAGPKERRLAPPPAWSEEGEIAGVPLFAPEATAVSDGLSIRRAPATTFASARALVEAELGRHPRSRLLAARLTRIVVGKDLWSRGQKATGVALPNAGWLVLDAGLDERSLRFAVHHELFHLLDRHVDGDPAWEATNEPEARYHRAYAVRPGRPSLHVDVSKKGFVSRYARASSAEDKAEVFAFLTVAPDEIDDAARRDPIVASKVRLVQERLEVVTAAR